MDKKKVKQVFAIVKGVIFVGICIGGFIAYQQIEKSKAQAKAINKIQKLLSSEKWQEYVSEHEKFCLKYPEFKDKYNDQLSSAYQNLAAEKYQEVLAMPQETRDQGYKDLLALFDKARELGKLSDESQMLLCDTYIEMGDLPKAEAMVKEAEERGDIPKMRIDGYKKLIERKKAPPAETQTTPQATK